MIRRHLLLGVLSLSTVTAFTLAACSSAPPGDAAAAEDTGSSPGHPAPPATMEAGSLGPSAPDAAAATTSPSEADDGSVDASGPSTTPLPAPSPPPPDAALPEAPGARLVTGTGIRVDGITDDGFIVYTSGSNVAAVPLAGGAVRPIHGGLLPPFVEVSGVAAYAWTPSFLRYGQRALDVWTSAHGAKTLSTDSPPGSPLATSADGTMAVFTVGTAGASPTLTVENLDGTGARPIGVQCATALGFDPSGDVIATDCDALMTDGGAPSPNVSVFAGPTLARTLLAPYASYATDPTGAWLWIEGTDAQGRLVRASNGATVFSDPSVTGPAFFDATGSRLYYVSGSALMSVSTASALPKTLVPGGCTSLLGLSPDGETLLYHLAADLYLAPVGGGAPTLLSANAMPAFGEYRFTSDSRYVIVLNDVPLLGYRFVALPLSGGDPVASRGRLRSVTVLAGSKVLAMGQSGAAQVLDVSGAEASLDLPSIATFAVSKDRTQIAYTATSVEQPGLYVVSTASAPGAADAGAGADGGEGD